jgi:hypothetical protein
MTKKLAILIVAVLAAVVTAWFLLPREAVVVAPPPAPLVAEVPEPPPPPKRVRPAERPATPPPRVVRVAVKSLDGKPIAGARVQLVRGPSEDLFDDRWEPSVDAPRAEFDAKAEDDGDALVEDVPAGRWYVVAEAPGFARHVVAGLTRGADDAGVDAAVALDPAATFAGTIRDPDGAPAKGIRVFLVEWGGWPSDASTFRATTAADGSYRFDGVEPGEYGLSYELHAGLVVDAARVLVPSLDGLDVREQRGAEIAGTVKDADTGAAVAGARVHVFQYVDSGISGLSGPTTHLDVGATDHLGRFALRTWHRQALISYFVVDADGYAPGTTDESDVDVDGAVAEGQRVVADLRVRRAATVKGTLSGPDGPLAGFIVRVSPKEESRPLPEHHPWSCVTGADGTFRIERVPLGAATIMVIDTVSGVPVADEIALDADRAGDLEHDVRLEMARVRVTRQVVDTDHQPVPGVDVSQAVGTFRATAKTDAEGRFTMEALSVGRFASVLLRREGFKDTFEFLHIDDDSDGTPLSPLERPATIAWTVVRPDGTPVGGVRIVDVSGIEGVESSAPLWTGRSETVTASDGTFRLSNASAPHDTWFVVRDADGLWSGDTEIENDRMTWPDRTLVTGRAVSADGGAPVAGALLVDATSRFVIARTGADGRFRAEWSHPSWDSLRLECDGWSPAKVASAAGEQRIEMKRSASIAGVVRGADGSPVPGVSVEVRAPDNAWPYLEWTSTASTDADGRFVVPGLGAGDWILSVHDASQEFAGARATVKSGASDVVLLARPAAKLIVRVVDAEDKPYGGAGIWVLPDAPNLAPEHGNSYTSEPTEFGVAPDTPYTIRVEQNGRETVERKDVRAGGDPIRITVGAEKPR